MAEKQRRAALNVAIRQTSAPTKIDFLATPRTAT
jgi:hypothetical protein